MFLLLSIYICRLRRLNATSRLRFNLLWSSTKTLLAIILAPKTPSLWSPRVTRPGSPGGASLRNEGLIHRSSRIFGTQNPSASDHLWCLSFLVVCLLTHELQSMFLLLRWWTTLHAVELNQSREISGICLSAFMLKIPWNQLWPDELRRHSKSIKIHGVQEVPIKEGRHFLEKHCQHQRAPGRQARRSPAHFCLFQLVRKLWFCWEASHLSGCVTGNKQDMDLLHLLEINVSMCFLWSMGRVSGKVLDAFGSCVPSFCWSTGCLDRKPKVFEKTPRAQLGKRPEVQMDVRSPRWDGQWTDG